MADANEGWKQAQNLKSWNITDKLFLDFNPLRQLIEIYRMLIYWLFKLRWILLLSEIGSAVYLDAGLW